MISRKEMVLGVAPTRRDYFLNEAVERNHKLVTEKTQKLCKKLGVRYVDCEGLNEEARLVTLSTVEGIRKRFADEGVNALFVPHCNFGQEESVLHLAKALGVPTLVWGPRDNAPDGFAWRDTDTQCGLFATGKALYRGNVPFTYIENCWLDDPAFEDGFEEFIAAASIVASLKNVRIAQISVRPQTFWSVMINESELYEKFGIEVVPVPGSEIVMNARKIVEEKRAEVAEVIEGYKKSGIDISKMSEQELSNMAGLELAILGFALENNCSAVVSECWHVYISELGVKGCAVFGNLIDRGLPVACETDVHGAISMLIAGAVNGWSEPCFLADVTVRHPTNDNAELLWHCGPFPKGLKKAGGHAFLSEGMGQWELKGGDLTLLRFDGCRGEYNLLVGEACTCDGPVTNGNYVWVEVDNWPRWERKLVCGPYIHHIAAVYGKHGRAIEEACKYLGGVKLDMP